MMIKRAGVNFELKLPSTRFRREVGVWAGIPTTPEGQPITQAEFDAMEKMFQEMDRRCWRCPPA